MSGTRQLILIVSMLVAMGSQHYAGSMSKDIACGAAADSAANKNTVTATQAGGFAALAVGVITALSSRIPALGAIFSRLGGAETLNRVVTDGAKILETGGKDLNPMVDLARLILEKGSPQALQLLGQLNLQLTGPTLPPAPGDPPSRDECVAQLIRRIEIDSARRITSETT